jgi:hypothetical protein
VANADPDVRCSGRVNIAALYRPAGPGVRIVGGGDYGCNVVWISVVKDRAN